VNAPRRTPEGIDWRLFLTPDDGAAIVEHGGAQSCIEHRAEDCDAFDRQAVVLEGLVVEVLESRVACNQARKFAVVVGDLRCLADLAGVRADGRRFERDTKDMAGRRGPGRVLLLLGWLAVARPAMRADDIERSIGMVVAF